MVKTRLTEKWFCPSKQAQTLEIQTIKKTRQRSSFILNYY